MNTDKIYAEQLANEYAPKDTSKVVALRKLDARAKLPATVFTYSFGIVAALIMGVGMCLSMKVIGNGTTATFVIGIIIGIIGLIGMGINYPIYRKMLKKGKEKYAFEIMQLAKEISEKAKVNRSTFYLHYETLEDLLSESVEYINEQFLDHMKQDSEAFIAKIRDCSLDELYLITPAYLLPYLEYIQKNRRIFFTALTKARTLRLDDSYNKMFRYVFTPILERYKVPVEDRKYIMSFYIQGIMAIITEWLKDDCKDTEEHIMKVIQNCVTQPKKDEEKL